VLIAATTLAASKQPLWMLLVIATGLTSILVSLTANPLHRSGRFRLVRHDGGLSTLTHRQHRTACVPHHVIGGRS
jgi:hypothetical protein